ncbi:MAG: hypothetical protein HUJ80_07495 [Firmicutes bacterium]|nr:hypothetical protein [Bacillota bacterium]
MGINRKIENLKNMVIVVLFLTAILLLYLLWTPDLKNIGADVLRDLTSSSKELPQAQQLVQPLYGAVSAGDGSFVMYTDGADAMMTAAQQELGAFLAQDSYTVQAISASLYQQAMAGWESVQLEMGYGFPLADFCRYFCGRSPDGVEEILFDTLAFSTASAESFFVVDRSAGKFYRIVCSEARDAVAAVAAAAGTPLSPCYAGSDILGGGDALICLSAESSLAPAAYTAEGGGRYIQKGSTIAERIFGDTFDFVRRITDTYGNVTYMYGYGEKTFYASIAGRYVYRTDSEGKDATGLFDDLTSALQSLSQWGGLDTGDLSIVLIDYDETGAGRVRARTFYFGLMSGNTRIFGDDICFAQVTVVGGSVTEMLRRLIEAQPAAAADQKEAAQPANVIANNSNHIYNILSNNTLAVASDEAFETASQQALTLVPGYYASDKNGELLPCWVLQMKNGTRFYFDLYTATPLGFARKGA